MERNKSIYRSDEQKNLYKALDDAYESEKLILDTYGDTVMIKRCRDDQDKDEEPSAGSNWGSKRKRAGKEPESTSEPKEKTSKSASKSKEGSKSHQEHTGKSTQVEEPIHIDEELEEPAHQEFDTGFTKEQPVDEITQHPDWFKKPSKPATPDHDWNKTLLAQHGPESSRDVYSKRRIIVVTKLQIVEWHNYKHLDWITIRRDDDKLRGEDLQLGIESYQKKLNLIKPDTYRSDLKRREAYTAYSNPRGFIYQNKDKKNRLMHIDELHKFSDGTLNDVRTTLDDCLKIIQMKYLPQTNWRQSDRDKAGAMI
uniref:Uncharacterized protein n=1 Tax=Tanacetum cinerariifolium TaxID=118510 RepID=A0A699HNU4_TANCI|nr:hypothetical protein [Tanacetum cinerariifolium]